MLAAAKLLAEGFSRLRQPAVVGEILAGVLIGPSLLGWVQPSPVSHLLAELGVMFLLFSVGLEIKPAAILRVGRAALLVAMLGVLVPFGSGFVLMEAFGGSRIESLFTGTALVATSVGISARILAEMGLLETRSARIILGAAVIDDILGLLVLAVVSATARGAVNVAEIAVTAVLAVAFVAAVGVLVPRLLTRGGVHIGRLAIASPYFVVSLLLCFGLALAASWVGVAAIIGAFLAGMALAEALEVHRDVHQQVRGVTELLVPYFLVEIGMQLKLEALEQSYTLWLAAAMTAVAVVSKLAGCGLGAAALGWRGALQVGAGMVPRGEVGIVVAQIGLAAGVVTDDLFAAVLAMAVATTLIAPPMIRPLFRR
ncbi:MAG: cation:proton antiporter [Gammaproteobacteria bacterium]|nr:cation:proton antiporter [Gammaproteobacteria bacterium]